MTWPRRLEIDKRQAARERANPLPGEGDIISRLAIANADQSGNEMVDQETYLDRVLTMEVGRCTEAAAIAASTMIGRGTRGADQAAVTALREAFNKLEMDGKVVIGEGERDEAPMLYIGEKVGTGERSKNRYSP